MGNGFGSVKVYINPWPCIAKHSYDTIKVVLNQQSVAMVGSNVVFQDLQSVLKPSLELIQCHSAGYDVMS